jgi:hypothetical protein
MMPPGPVVEVMITKEHESADSYLQHMTQYYNVWDAHVESAF